MDEQIKKYLEKYERLNEEIFVLCDKRDDAEFSDKKEYQLLKKEIKLKDAELEALEEEFARYVFNKYKDIKPKLRSKDKKTVKWEDVYGDDFDKISKLRRFTLTTLFNKDGYYRIK